MNENKYNWKEMKEIYHAGILVGAIIAVLFVLMIIGFIEVVI